MIGPKFYAWDRNGKPLAFGKLYTYEARTNTPKDTYQSEDQVVANPNPVILNGEGYANIYLDGSYKMVLKDSDDNEIWSADPVTSGQAEEWQSCFSASYVSSNRFDIVGNVTEQYEVGGSVRINNGTPNYIYSFITSSVFAGGNTQVTINEAVVPVDIISVCTSIVSSNSTLGLENKIDTEIAQQRTRFLNTDQDNSNIKEALACIPRCVAGVFDYLNDAGHEPLGVSTMEQPDDYRIRMNYSKVYEQVNSMVIAIDNELAPYGVFCGGNVGTAWAEFTGYAQLTGLLKASDLSFTSTALIAPADTTVDLTDNVLTLTHATAVNGDVPVVSVVNKENNMPRISVSYNATKLQIRAITDLAGLVRWSGTQFEFWPGIPTYIAPDQAGISFSEANGTLTVNHPSTFGYDIQVSAFGSSSHNVKIDNVSGSSFDVTFHDIDTGAKIAVADTGMKVFIKRKMDLKAILPTNMEFLVRGPIVPVKSANFSNIAGNNFWVSAIMENPL